MIVTMMMVIYAHHSTVVIYSLYIYMHYDVNDTTYVVNWLSDDTDYTLEY